MSLDSQKSETAAALASPGGKAPQPLRTGSLQVCCWLLQMLTTHSHCVSGRADDIGTGDKSPLLRRIYKSLIFKPTQAWKICLVVVCE